MASIHCSMLGIHASPPISAITMPNFGKRGEHTAADERGGEQLGRVVVPHQTASIDSIR